MLPPHRLAGQESHVSMISPNAATGNGAVPVMNLAGIRGRQGGTQRYNFPFLPIWL